MKIINLFKIYVKKEAANWRLLLFGGLIQANKTAWTSLNHQSGYFFLA
ncbi:hypothetical protein HBHAL_2057 [Halobacillus halophilus DSM 2266]|uniref:Uncharacterized protein n=1 Tax=Halobacillus halophilus (strain ATCC 35676 / DSM 2266 / JCM 20832 / KCTC 3685 / LMG 17431 / NBRC 102448 / NCIMB 2269) TaxID=866895 RepID=I0JJU9_HALH3|nr:hypothetical protein HBHAL_2057 [Halobacillus halophilus DSM 2266]